MCSYFIDGGDGVVGVYYYYCVCNVGYKEFVMVVILGARVSDVTKDKVYIVQAICEYICVCRQQFGLLYS